ncbi:MAG: GntR family transcriptional regulator [Oceanicoccus sp.]
MNSLDSRSPVPLYYQLAEQLLADIRSGVYAIGDKIPSEQAMAANHAVGRPTVRQATEWLIRQGYLERKRGSGTYVLQTSPKRLDVLSMAGTSAALHASGVADPFEIVEPLSITGRSSEMPDEVTGGEFWRFSRLSKNHQTPLMIETFYLSKVELPAFDLVDLESLRLSDFIQSTHHEKPVKTVQTFSITQPTLQQAKALKWDGPLILVKRIVSFQSMAPIYCEMLCRTDQFEFSQTLGVENHG